MDPLWKISKFLLIFTLAFSLFGCGTSEETKVVSPKEENTEKLNKEEIITEEAKTATTPTNIESDIENTAEKEITANTTEESSIPTNSEPTKSEPAKSSQPAPTKPKETTPAPTASNPSTNTATQTQPVTTAPALTPAPTPAPVVEKTVNISIVGPNGTIVGEKKVEFQEGNTILDVLIQVTGKNNIDYSGSGATAYVHGMYNFYEFDYGATSGWTYKVNGVQVSKSAGAVKVKEGDKISWIYTKG